MRSRVMYIEKFGGLGSRGGRIGRVYFSQTEELSAIEAAHFNLSRARATRPTTSTRRLGPSTGFPAQERRRRSTLPGIVEIDDDVNEEYWLNVRNLPALVGTVSYKSLGKYSRSGKREKRPAGVLSPKRKKAT